MALRAEGRARRLARFFHIPVTVPTGIVKSLFGGDLGILCVTAPALLRRRSFLIVVVALLAVLHRIDMFFVAELNPLVFIPRVKPGILDGERILLTEDALQDEQGSKEHNCGDNRKDLFVHEP